MERNIDVSFANLDDQEMVELLIDEAKEGFEVKTKSLTGDGAYGSAKILSSLINSLKKTFKIQKRL